MPRPSAPPGRSSARPTAAALLLLALCGQWASLASARALLGSQEAQAAQDGSPAGGDAAAADLAGRQLLAPAVDPTIGTRIVGGTTASPTRFPYLASLRTAAGAHFCGGAWCRWRERGRQGGARAGGCSGPSSPACTVTAAAGPRP